MLKKAGFVTATTAALMMVGGTAFAASPVATEGCEVGEVGDGYVTFEDAYYTFVNGGGALGYGAASLVTGAYTGILQSPQNFVDSLGDDPGLSEKRTEPTCSGPLLVCGVSGRSAGAGPRSLAARAGSPPGGMRASMPP